MRICIAQHSFLASSQLQYEEEFSFGYGSWNIVGGHLIESGRKGGYLIHTLYPRDRFGMFELDFGTAQRAHNIRFSMLLIQLLRIHHISLI